MGNFTIDHTLLLKHCTFENIVKNIQQCEPLTEKNIIAPSDGKLKKVSRQDHESFLEMLDDVPEEFQDEMEELNQINEMESIQDPLTCNDDV